MSAQPSDNEAPPLRSPGVVAILGLGLIGGSVGLALRARGAAGCVLGWSRSERSRRAALDRGAVDEVAETPEGAAGRADLVVLGGPVGSTVPLLRAVAPVLRPGAVVTDVGSVKARLVGEAEAVLPGRFVGGHPMAGSEQTGVEHARADLLQGACWVVTATPGVAEAAVARVEALARAVGARPLRCDPATHDRVTAAVSHLPHLAAFALATVAGERTAPSLRGLAAGSFRDGTRVAGSDPAMWAGILLDNADEVLAALDALEKWVAAARERIEQDDAAGLEAMLAQGREARRDFTPPVE